MSLNFIGHACFSLQFSKTRVLTDPYSPEIGYLPVDEAPNLVMISHQNPKWHSYLDDVRGEFQTFRGLEFVDETVFVDEVKLEAVRVWEKLPNDGPNAMIKIIANELRVLHMGDCGHALSAESVAACGEVDVLLAPAGGPPTLELSDLMRFVDELQPKIVVPMHFAVPNLGMKLQPVESFVDLWPRENVIVHPASSMEISRDSLPHETQLHVLQPARLK